MRIDQYLVEKNLVATRSKAADYIRRSLVLINDQIVQKAGQKVHEKDKVEILVDTDYVGRGAYKLLTALNHFSLDVKDRAIVDVGASTGGFTDLLLQKGAAKALCIDVGTDQLALSLRQNSKVTSLENTNILNLTTIDPPFDFIVVDVSFVSLKKIFPHLLKICPQLKDLILLFKPQFEHHGKSFKNGIVGEQEGSELLQDFILWAKQEYNTAFQHIASDIKGKAGNQEYLLYCFFV